MEPETLFSCLSGSAAARGEKTAITFLRGGEVETEISYGDLLRDANRLSALFLGMGVARGERVLLLLDKSLFFVTAYLALQRIGAISVPLNPGFKEAELAYLLQDTEACLVLCGPSQIATVKRLDAGMRTMVVDTEVPYGDLGLLDPAADDVPEARLGGDDPGLIIYTSGTTGDPKGAVLTQRNIVHDTRNIIDIWEISEDDVLCHALPLFHVHGLCFALQTALTAGAHVIMLDRFSPEKVIDILTRKSGGPVCTVFMAVPPMYTRLLDFVGERRHDFSHIRLWTSGSAPLPVSDFARIREVFGREPVEREGMSETGMNFSNPYRGTKKPGTIGLPLPRLQVRIVDPGTFTDVEPGQVGELWLRGPSITPGYWRKPAETAEAFVDGWFRTGDLGKVDEDGYYSITDRLKNIIISGGENISPQEIQGVINRLDGVVESAVVGVPCDQWGEKVVAAVVVEGEVCPSPDEIRSHCREQLHDWKTPKEVLLVKDLPRNTMGKVLNGEVRRLFDRE